VPLVTVVALPPTHGVEDLLAGVVTAAADALGRPGADVWARFVPAAGAVAGTDVETRASQHPVVTVTTRPQPPEVVERTLRAVAGAVAHSLLLDPSHVWARWDQLADGTVLADGAVA